MPCHVRYIRFTLCSFIAVHKARTVRTAGEPARPLSPGAAGWQIGVAGGCREPHCQYQCVLSDVLLQGALHLT